MTIRTKRLIAALAVAAPLALAGPAGAAEPDATASQVPDNRPMAKLAIDQRAFFEYANGKPTLTVYYENVGRTDLAGSIVLKYGKTTLPEINKGVNNSLDVDADEDSTLSNFRLPKKLVQRIERRGGAKLSLSADMKAESGETATVRQTMSVRKAGLTNDYDGYYKGTGGLVINVSGGFLTSISVGLNAYCSRSSEFMLRSLYTLSGYPLMIGRDGSFTAKGSQSPDTIRYEGKLSKNGTGKGYLSLFHTKLDVGSEGNLQVDQCYAASNWKAKRVRK